MKKKIIKMLSISAAVLLLLSVFVVTGFSTTRQEDTPWVSGYTWQQMTH